MLRGLWLSSENANSLRTTTPLRSRSPYPPLSHSACSTDQGAEDDDPSRLNVPQELLHAIEGAVRTVAGRVHPARGAARHRVHRHRVRAVRLEVLVEESAGRPRRSAVQLLLV